MPIDGFTDEALRTNESLAKYDSLDALGKDYLNLQTQSDPAKWRDRLPEDLRNGGDLPESIEDLVKSYRAGGKPPTWEELRNGLPDDLKSDPSLTFKDMESLVRSYIETKGLVGRKRALPPDTDEAGLDALYADLGRPEAPDKYELKPPENFPKEFYSEEMEKSYRDLAHKARLNQKQTAEIYNGFMGMEMDVIGQVTAAEANARKEAETALKAEWGDQYDAKLAAANKALQSLGGEDPAIAAALEQKDPIFNNPIFARMLMKVGEAIGESGLVKADQAAAATSMQAEYNKLISSKAYMDRESPDHKGVVDKVNAMAAKLWPGTEE